MQAGNRGGRGRAQGRGGFGGRGNQAAIRRNPPEPVKGLIPSLPLLIYGTDESKHTSVKYLEWHEKMGEYVGANITEMSSIFAKVEPALPANPEPAPPLLEEGAAEPSFVSRTQYTSAYATYAKKKAVLEVQQVKVFAVLMGQLDESTTKHALRRDPTFDDILADKDPFQLLLLLDELCLTGVDFNEDEDALKEDRQTAALSAYTSCKQAPRQSVEDYYKAFSNTTRVMTALEMGEQIPNAQRQAQSFITGLSPERFGQLQLDIANGTLARAASLDAAYQRALNYKVLARRGQYPVDSVAFVSAAEACEAPSEASAFYLDRGGRGGRGEGRGGRGGGSGRGGGGRTDTGRNAGRGGGARNGGRGRGRGSTNPASAAKPCSVCGSQFHWKDRCPTHLREAVVAAEVAEQSAKAAKDRATTATAHIARVLPNFMDEEYDDMPPLVLDSDEPEHLPSASLLDEAVSAQLNSTVQDDRTVPLECNTMAAGMALLPTEVGLDTMASRGIFSNADLCTNIHTVHRGILMGGVRRDGEKIFTDVVGSSTFGQVFLSSQASCNLVSFAQVSAIAHSVVFEGKAFLVQMVQGGPIYRFAERDGLYIHDCAGDAEEELAMMGTVEQNKAKYEKREVKAADDGRELQRLLGGQSTAVVSRLLRDGSITHTDVLPEDVERAAEIYGKSLRELKGSSTAHKPIVIPLGSAVPVVREQQEMHIDLMFINGMAFLLSVLVPMRFVMVAALKSRATPHVWAALQKQLAIPAARGIKIAVVRTDNEGAVMACESKLNEMGITVNPVGATGTVPIPERAIRTVKQHVRGIIATTIFTVWRGILLIGLVYFVVSVLNMVPSTTSTHRISPREQMTGRRVDARRDLRLAFGDYVQASPEKTDNTNAPRTVGGVYLYSKGNREGSVVLLNLSTGAIFTRQHFTPLPMPVEVIERLNILGGGVKERISRPLFFGDGSPDNLVLDTADDLDETQGPEQDQTTAGPGALPLLAEPIDQEYVPLDPFAVYEETAGAPMIVPADQQLPEGPALDMLPQQEWEEQQLPGPSAAVTESTTSELIPDMPDLDDLAALPATQEQPHIHRYGLRPRLGQQPAPRAEHGMHITVKTAIEQMGKPAIKAIVEEMLQLETKNVWSGVDTRTLTHAQRSKVIPSSLFLKEKFTASGEFDKLKARLVAGGHMQDREVHGEGASSPTVSTAGLFALVAIAAAEGRAVATVDFPGAFLEAVLPADDEPVFMRLDKFLTSVLLKIDPSYASMVREDGTLVVKLNRALYGLIKSAQQWYQELKSNLEGHGFVVNPYDACVFNRIEADNEQTTLAVHVDDMEILAANEAAIDLLLDQLKSRFPKLSVHRGRVLDYLGMTFDFSVPGKVKITMNGYVTDLLKDCDDIPGTVDTPATSTLFSVSESSPSLSQVARERFHSLVAKLLYLSKRARPDILVAVSFLTTRVLCATLEDEMKVTRVVRYLRGTKSLGIVLEASKFLCVTAYVDASYGTHPDCRSHTGIVISIGKGPVYAASSKQKLNTKSSTEAELVGLSDSTGQVIWMRNFLEAQGYSMPPAVIHQDNMSTIALVKNGRSTSARTRHIAIRYFFVADRVKSKEISIQYMHTDSMLADILTKPLSGAKFIQMRDALLNWTD
jgi:hypothetical protein